MECNNDVDVDSLLLQQFSSMATQDREVLVVEMQKLLGDQLSADEYAFFLDMSNWNLQAAICSYLEYQQDIPVVPKVSMIDSGLQETPNVPPNTAFRKTWRMLNTGNQVWPPGCCLRFVEGTQMTTRDLVMVDTLEPSSATEVTLELVSPDNPGNYRGTWRMSTINGTFFGDFLRVTVNVCNGDDQVFDGMATEMSQALTGVLVDSSHMDDSVDDNDVRSQGTTGHFQSGACMPHSNVIGFQFQAMDSLKTQSPTLTNSTPSEPDADTMETS